MFDNLQKRGIPMKKFLLIAILVSFSYNSLMAQDAQIILSELMFNKFLNAIGSLSGKGKFKKGFIKTDYTWKIRNARIDLELDKATFYADADIKAKGVKFTEKVTGSVDVKFDPVKNLISVKVREAKFDVKIFGVRVATIDLARYYKPKFQFEGPKPLQKVVTVDMPDGKTKTINITTVRQNFRILKDKIVVVSIFEFKS